MIMMQTQVVDQQFYYHQGAVLMATVHVSGKVVILAIMMDMDLVICIIPFSQHG